MKTFKVYYFSRYPPALNTTTKPKDTDIIYQNSHTPDEVTKETFIDFINSTELTQVNGNWKGGSWGADNFTVTSLTWCCGLFINDEFTLSDNIIHGIVKYSNVPIINTDTIIPESEEMAWTSNITVMQKSETNHLWFPNCTRKEYRVYITENPMPQKAIDVYALTEINGILYVMITKRGNSAYLDMKELYCAGAGEHIEPTDNKKKYATKLDAIYQELGVINQDNAEIYMIPGNKYESPGRDPRYDCYSAIQNDKIITFGIERYSVSKSSICYITCTDKNEFGITPNTHSDKTEITNSKWTQVSDFVQMLDNKQLTLMLGPEHDKMFKDALIILEQFSKLPEQEKQVFKIIQN
jgi:isopentenyldiphosphate isomerase